MPTGRKTSTQPQTQCYREDPRQLQCRMYVASTDVRQETRTKTGERQGDESDKTDDRVLETGEMRQRVPDR